MRNSECAIAAERHRPPSLSALFFGLSLLCFSSTEAREQNITTEPDTTAESHTQYVNSNSTSGTHLPTLPQSCLTEYLESCDSNCTDLQCLLSQWQDLRECCHSETTGLQRTNSAGNQQANDSIVLRNNTTLNFRNNCETATAITTTTTKHGPISLAAGPVIFDSNGVPVLARLNNENPVHGLPLAAEQPLSLIYNNGTPKNIRLSSTGRQNGIAFGPIGALEARYARNPELSTVPAEYLHLLAKATRSIYDPGTTRLHSNGRVALGRVAEPATVNGVPIAEGITRFTEDGNVISGTLSGSYDHDGWKLTAGEITFNNEGKLLKAVLAENATVNQWQITGRATIEFDYAGTPKSLVFGRGLSATGSDYTAQADSLLLNENVYYNLYPNGQIKKVTLAGASWYRGKMYPRGTNLRFNENGDVSWDSFYDEFLVRAANGQVRESSIPEILPAAEVRRGLWIPAGSLVYPVNSHHQKFIVRHPFDYKGLRLSAGEFLIGHDNNIVKATLNGDQLVHGLTLKGRSVAIDLHPSGRIKTAYLAADQNYRGFRLRGLPYKTHLSDSGELLSATLAQQAVVNGISFAADHKIQFDNSGRVRSGTLAKPFTQGEFTFKAETVVQLDPAGQVERGYLSKNHRIGKVLIPTDSKLTFGRFTNLEIESVKHIEVGQYRFLGDTFRTNSSGSVYAGTLALDAVINGRQFSAGTWVFVNKNGEVENSEFAGLPQPFEPAIIAFSAGPQAVPMPVLTMSSCRRNLDSAMNHGSNLLLDQIMLKCLRLLAEER